MRREMESQPTDLAEALVDLRSQAANLRLPRPTQVVLTGSGDSGHAAMALEVAFARQLGLPVWAMPSATAARYAQGGTGGLSVVISVSGEVRRTIEAAMAAQAIGSNVIAITAGGDSTLVGIADGALIMPAPISRATPHTRDYTMTLLALLALLEALAARPIAELDAWPAQVRQILSSANDWADRLASRFASSSGPVWFLGMGPDRGTAAYGALKFWEAGGSAAWWDDLEEFGHGSQLVARPGELAVLFACGPAAGRAAEMADGLTEMGLVPTLITDGPQNSFDGFELPRISAELSPLLASIPPQVLSYAFATERGIDVALSLGGSPLGEVYDRVHRNWMRNSALAPLPAE